MMKAFYQPILTPIAAIVLLGGPAPAAGQKLPTGEYHTNRERSYDLTHLRAELRFDFEAGRVHGRATLDLVPLRPLASVAIDAILLEVESVNLGEASLAFKAEGHTLEVTLPAEQPRGEPLSLTVRYAAKPRAGMYFQRDWHDRDSFYVSTYGEGGLHANWLPVYNDVNDKFSTEMLVSVPEPYVAISNGRLMERREDGGLVTYHWLQELPHSNYLISIYVGQFERGQLEPGLGRIPQSYWVPKGRLAEGAYAFRNTTRMVEYFSRRFDYPYPWDKHDQIAVPDYAIGAMEHTGITGHLASVLRREDAPVDFGPPGFREIHTDWTAEKTIAHELAHHWFGDNVTCRNLAHLWLNESFASYLMMLWSEESLGRDELDLDADLARRHYFDYVATEHTIRGLEHHYFDDPRSIYNTEHTYLKGAAVLHMLRGVLGDDDFFDSLAHYLDKHEYQNVEGTDLRIAIEESAGRNLGWFFDDWITGGGHPVFEVSYRYLPARGLIDIAVGQVQPLVEGQGLFRLPVELTVETASGRRTETVWVEQATHHFLRPADGEPRLVSFDGRGHLVAEIHFAKPAAELAYQARNDAFPGRLRALRQLATSFPGRGTTLEVLAEILAGEAYWGLQAEAAKLLGEVRTPAAEALAKQALAAPEYRVRKAAVLGLARFGTPSSRELLRRLIGNESHSHVVGTALVALAHSDPGAELELFRQQLGRASWYDEITLASLRAFRVLAEEGEPAAGEIEAAVRPYADARWNQSVRQAAFEAWAAAKPDAPELHRALLEVAQAPPYSLQQFALEALGTLRVAGAKAMLEEMVELDFDANLTVLAKGALEKIRRLQNFEP